MTRGHAGLWTAKLTTALDNPTGCPHDHRFNTHQPTTSTGRFQTTDSTKPGVHQLSPRNTGRLTLQAEYSLGLRESITRRYDELTRSLDEQLGLEPARETRLVYRQLLGRHRTDLGVSLVPRVAAF